jgi:hypothetical protein
MGTPTAVDLLQGIVVETKTKSFLGPLFYSDKKCYNEMGVLYGANYLNTFTHQSTLNELSRIYVIGIAAGVTRMALATIHTLGHLFAAAITFDKGHCFHAAKGACEFLRGLIEAIPIAGRIFANHYVEDGYWWMIKIYNPNAPDSLDISQSQWSQFKVARPTGYVVA